MGERFPRILPKVATSTSLLGSFTCRKFTTWDRRLYFPSEGRRAEDFFALKNPIFIDNRKETEYAGFITHLHLLLHIVTLNIEALVLP